MVGRALIVAGLALAAQAGGAGADADWEALARVADPGERAAAIAEALEGTDELPPRALEVAFRVGVEEARALRLENARLVQAALHERARAPWSATDLALTLALAGETARADEVLAEQIARAPETSPERADLLARHALVAYGSGKDDVALDRLGRALAAGSRDAAVVLGRLHLGRGNTPAARACFRASLLGGEPGAWALRGWGLTLIHPPQSRPPGAPLRPATAESQR